MASRDTSGRFAAGNRLGGRRAPPMPDDFPLYAAIEGNLKLRKRFGVGGATIERWREAQGLRYNRPAMPKTVPIATKKRIRRRWEAQERIEDLEDFGINDCARSLGIRDFEREW